MKHLLWVACLMLAMAAGAAPTAPRAAAKPPARPKQHNQFATVDELIKARRPAKTLVSAEGYIVVGWKAADGSVRVSLTDSVDHVLTANDAMGAARAGLAGTLKAADVKKNARWGWTDKGLRRFAQFAGTPKGKPTTMLHDTVARVRVTGITASRAAIGAVTIVEYADDNGDWKRL